MSRLPPLIHRDAPAERLAALRIALGVFAVTYLVLRIPVVLRLRDREAQDFAGVGVFRWLDGPLPDAVVTIGVVAAVGAGVAFVAGACFAVSGPVFAATMFALCTYRSSWGQLLHFENLMVLHLVVVAVAASADAWSVDAHRRRARGGTPNLHDYASPLRLVCIVVVVTYVIAGIAKLRYGGLDWIFGDALRNHVAYSAARLDLLGGTPSPFAEFAVRQAWMFPPMAAAAVAIELVAPIALFGGWYRNVWVAAAWMMHLGIAALMFIVFPYPVFLLAFAPFFPLERIVRWLLDLAPSRTGPDGTVLSRRRAGGARRSPG
ncbi:MAG: HTTM domain-containing protein [Ilumatobacteraceae bacterium]